MACATRILSDAAAARRMFPAIVFGVTTTTIVPILLAAPTRAICRMHELVLSGAPSGRTPRRPRHEVERRRIVGDFAVGAKGPAVACSPQSTMANRVAAMMPR